MARGWLATTSTVTLESTPAILIAVLLSSCVPSWSCVLIHVLYASLRLRSARVGAFVASPCVLPYSGHRPTCQHLPSLIAHSADVSLARSFLVLCAPLLVAAAISCTHSPSSYCLLVLPSVSLAVVVVLLFAGPALSGSSGVCGNAQYELGSLASFSATVDLSN